MAQWSFKRHIDEKTARTVQRILDDETISSQKRSAKAFDLFMNDVLKDLDPADARGIRELLRKRTFFYPTEIPKEMGSYYYPEADEIYILYPERYRNTILDFKIRVHEACHAIQLRILSRQKGWPRDYGRQEVLVREARRYEALRYAEETGAMGLEAQLMLLVPEREREMLTRLVARDSGLHPASKRYFLRSLKNARSPEEYVARMHQAGHYDRKQIARLYPDREPAPERDLVKLNERMLARRRGLVLSALVGAEAMNLLCAWMRASPDPATRETWAYRNVCQKALELVTGAPAP